MCICETIFIFLSCYCANACAIELRWGRKREIYQNVRGIACELWVFRDNKGRIYELSE